MDYLPPGRVVKVGDQRFPRYAIRDGLGQYWAGDENRWRDKPSDAVLFGRQLDAVAERNRHCLGDTADFPLFAGRPLPPDGHGTCEYALAGEAMAAGTVTVSEVSENGEVPVLVADNGGDQPVLFIEGEESIGRH